MPFKDAQTRKEYEKRYWDKHRKRRKEIQAKFRANNKEKVNNWTKEALRKERLEHPERIAARARKSKLKITYGITPEEYDSILASQLGVCAGCKKESTKRKLAVDHDHITGKIRGLLCDKCNRALGLLYDKISTLDNLKKYLELHK